MRHQRADHTPHAPTARSRVRTARLAAGLVWMGLGTPALAQDQVPAPTQTQPQDQAPSQALHAPTQGSASGVRVPNQGVRVTTGGVRPGTSGVRANTAGVRVTSGGVRVTAGGVRATSAGVRVTTGGVRVSGGGVRVYGGTGSTPGSGSQDPDHGTVVCYPSPYWGWGWGWGGTYRWGWWTIPGSYRGTVDGPANRSLVGSAPEEQPEPPTPIESARWWMAEGDAEEAVAWYRIHLDEHPDDVRAMRAYAAALLESGRSLDAVAVMGYAYDLVPGLANEPMEVGLWGGSVLRLRESVVDAVRFGHASPSGSAWLLVSVLMQAEGRDGVAVRMIDRAEVEGLGSAVSDRMRLALTQR